MEALAPGASGDAFEPYQSTSPNGAWILDVRKVEDEDSGMSFAAIRVLSAETGETLYDCPDRWRLWDLHGIDWLCDGTILVDSSDTGMARYGADTEGAWQPMDAQAGLASLAPAYDDGYARLYEQDGWRTVEVRGDHRHAYVSLDAEGKTRLDMLHSNLTLAELKKRSSKMPRRPSRPAPLQTPARKRTARCATSLTICTASPSATGPSPPRSHCRCKHPFGTWAAMAGESGVLFKILLLHIVPPAARTLRISGFMRKRAGSSLGV